MKYQLHRIAAADLLSPYFRQERIDPKEVEQFAAIVMQYRISQKNEENEEIALDFSVIAAHFLAFLAQITQTNFTILSQYTTDNLLHCALQNANSTNYLQVYIDAQLTDIAHFLAQPAPTLLKKLQHLPPPTAYIVTNGDDIWLLPTLKAAYFGSQAAPKNRPELPQKIDYAHIVCSELNEHNTTEFAKLLSARHLCAEKDAQSNEERYIAELYYLIGANSNPHPQSLFAQTLFALEQETHPRDYAKLAHAYGDKNEARLLGTAQYLTTIWLGRLLFAKLVETRLINYHSNDSDRYRFLFLIQNDFYIKENIDGVNNKIIESWQNLDEIFEKVLHTPPAKREKSWQNKYAAIPFLQCSLFEKTPIETQTIGIAALTTEKKIPLYANTLLDTATAPDELPLLDYFLHLLNIADFGTKTIVGSLHTNGQLQLSPAVLTGVWEYWAAATGGTALNKTAAQNLYALLQNKSLPPTLSDRFFMPIAGSPQATAIALIHAAENQLLLPASAHEIPPITLFWQQDGLQVILSDGSLHEYEIKFERKLRRLPILAQPIQEAMMQAFTNAINQNISYANELPHLNWMSQWSLYAVLLQFMYYRQGNNTQLAPFAPIQLSQNEGALLLDRTLSESELLQNARLQARLQKLRTVYYTQFDAPTLLDNDIPDTTRARLQREMSALEQQIIQVADTPDTVLTTPKNTALLLLPPPEPILRKANKRFVETAYTTQNSVFRYLENLVYRPAPLFAWVGIPKPQFEAAAFRQITRLAKAQNKQLQAIPQLPDSNIVWLILQDNTTADTQTE